MNRINYFPKVSIIILNWNGLKDTIECLESLKKIIYPNYEVIIIDNGSKGNDADILENKYKDYIRLIRNKENLGFAGGNNIGIRYALSMLNPDYILLLNNDTVVDPNFLTELIKVAESNMQIGSCQPKILFLHNKNIINNIGINVYKDGSATNKGINQKDINLNQIKEIFGTCAAAALYRKKAFEDVGLLDESFFAYMEDVDLAWRLRINGWKSLLVPNSRVYHAHSASAPSSKFKIFLINRNTIFVLIKNLPFRYVLLFPINYVLLRLKFLKTKKIRFGDFKKNITWIDLIFTLFKSWISALYFLPSLIRKRHIIQKNKRIKKKELFLWFKIYSPFG